MSIATDESFAWHDRYDGMHGGRATTYLPEVIDAAYIAGRTAEVTDAEVEAVAKALYMKKAWNRLDEVTPRWDDQSPEVRGNYMMNAKSLLKVARQAVTE